VFLSGGTATTREVFCFDAVKGDLLWQRPVPLAPAGAEGAEVPEQTGHAAATVTTDGERVFALFATGELAALDFGGGMVWTKQLGAPRNPYGHSTSLVVWEGHLLVQFDQGEAEAGKSRLYSFEPATGRERWQQRRAVPSSWATPIVLEIAQRYQVVTLGEPWVISYDLAEGNEIWRAECMGTDVAPSPVFAAGLVFVASPHKHVVALRPDGQGDVSKTHLAWSSEENIPDITSPVCNGELLFTVTTYGILTCFDAKSGAKIWEHELDQEVNASPLLAGQRLYVMSTQGTTIQVAAERTYRELGRAELGEAVFASPAAVKDRLYVRSVKHLYGIGTASTPPAP
jgi:outer membrane protein assembly factor BamB